MIVIVGHGPSVRNNALGSVIDSFETVIRLKRAATDPVHRGTRTDIICSRSADHEQPGVRFWLYPDCISDWVPYWKRHSRHPKPSTGTSAIFCAAEILKPEAIALIGFDNVLHPNPRHPNHTWGHDSPGEHSAVMGLGIRIIDLVKREQVC